MTRFRGILTSKEVIVAVVTSILTVIATVIAGVIVVEWSQRNKVDNRLAIVDVAFAKGTGGAEALDVKVRNAGDIVAFLKHVRLDVRKQWSPQPQSVFLHATKPSGEYELVLPVMRAPFSVTAPLSQTVAANEPDQFRLNINSFGSNFMEHQLFLVAVTLLYNESSSEVTSEPVVIAMGSKVRLEEMYSQSPVLGRIPGAIIQADHPNEPNVALAKEIAALAVRKSSFASAIVDAVLRSEKKTGK